MKLHLFKLALILTSLSHPLQAQFAIEDADDTGVTNPSDFSWRYYQEALQRFPSRVGMVCHAAYILDKTGSHTQDTIMFMETCAEHGSVSSMIYLAALYENGNRMPIDLEKAADWMKRGADANDEAGYSNLAAYHYGVVLLHGRGVTQNTTLAREYLQRAADAGVTEAMAEINVLNARSSN